MGELVVKVCRRKEADRRRGCRSWEEISKCRCEWENSGCEEKEEVTVEWTRRCVPLS